MTGRADPFGDDVPDTKMDLTGFKPRRPLVQTKPEEIRKVAERAAFPSREAIIAPPPWQAYREMDSNDWTVLLGEIQSETTCSLNVRCR